jgi:hypothetical protein
MSFEFTPYSQPFPEWHGPYSPARGDDWGFRVREGLLMTVVATDDGREEWLVRQSEGAELLQQVVRSHWGGGRVLLLPNGLVVKPNPDGSGERWVIGQIVGPVILDRPDGTEFNLADPGELNPGDRWPGPGTTGIECVIKAQTGRLCADTRVPTPTGFLETTFEVLDSDDAIAQGFQLARLGIGGGRVRVTANGHVITNRQRHGRWECVYVGQIDVSEWAHREEWAEGVIVEEPYRLDVDGIVDAIEDIDEIDEFHQGMEEAEAEPDESDSHRFGDVQYASEEWGSSASEDESEEETDCDDESVEEDEEYLDANDEDNYDEEPAEVVIAPSPQPSQLVAQGAPQTSSVVDSRSADPRRSPPSPERLEAFASRGPSTANEAPTGFWGWLSGALRRKPR